MVCFCYNNTVYWSGVSIGHESLTIDKGESFIGKFLKFKKIQATAA